MNQLPANASLKEVNAYKKKLSWGDVPPIYTMASVAVGELDGILVHGFESAYKMLFDKNNWNLNYLQGHIDQNGNITVKKKPKIALRHIYNEQHYELHCYPIVEGERINRTLVEHPHSPFINWAPESMRMLFRLSNIVSFIVFVFRSGDEADMALIKYAHCKVEELISHLRESFEIVDVVGYSLASFCRAIKESKSALEINQLLDDPSEDSEQQF